MMMWLDYFLQCFLDALAWVTAAGVFIGGAALVKRLFIRGGGL